MIQLKFQILLDFVEIKLRKLFHFLQMRKLLLTILLFAGAVHIGAQTPFTEQLQKTVPGKGTVVLYQSQAITDLVNGVDASAPAGKVVHETGTTTGTAKPQDVLTDLPSGNASAVKVRMNGYRIQVYSGGNSRQAKNEATMMGNRVKSLFMDLSVYTHFSSPHWICRVGDFRTYEEANEVFRQLKETGRFREAVIVRSKVNVSY